MLTVTIQLKIPVEKATDIRERLDKLHRRAVLDRIKLENKINGGDLTEKRAAELEEAKSLELAMNMTNMLRALVEAGFEALDSDEKLIEAILANNVPRGRRPDAVRLALAKEAAK